MQRKSSKRTMKRTARKRDRSQAISVDLGAGQRACNSQADTILAFLEQSRINNFLREAVVESLAAAAERVGHPQMAPALKDGKLVVTENSNPHFQDLRSNLSDLVCLTESKMFTLRKSGREKVAQAVADILTIEEAPALLFNKVADFIMEGGSGDIRGLWKPPLVGHLIDFVNEKEAQDDEEEKE